PRPCGELVAVTSLSPTRVQEVIRAFAERDFLRIAAGDSLDGSQIDLTHESVMWQWPLLKGWIAHEAEIAAALRFIAESAEKQVPLAGSALKEARILGQRLQESPVWASRYFDADQLQAVTQWISYSEELDARMRKTLSEQRDLAAARELFAWAALSLTED